MVSSILKQTAGILRKQKNSKRWQKGFWCLAIAVVVGTVAILTMTGQALTHKTKVLNCQLEVHEHTDDCYDEDDNLICGYADYAVHVHNDDCYDSEGNLVCTLPEIEEHEHTDECYEEQQILICEAAEAAGTEGHVHTEECYETVEAGQACDTEEHTHDDSCYEETLTCNTEEHTHEEGCYDENGELICGKEEHIHDGSCYESALTCGKEEHTHDDSCAGTTEKVLKCGKEESEGVAGHTHTEECYKTEKVLTCGKLELHTHEQALVEDGGCYDESAFDEETGEFIEGSLPVCGLLQLEEHTHGEDCFEVVEAPEVHAHSANCYDENGNLICGFEDAVDAFQGSITQTYEGEGFKVTAEYTAAAKIPAEAELIAEQITADDNEEHYTQREAEYRESVESESATMWALLKIGFYVDGEEIEPESPVTLTVQMLDEAGMPEGSPITVVHFGEEGTEVLDGSRVENGSTTFQMESFSEIAIGYRPSKEGGMYVSQSFRYEDEALQVTFHVQGEVAAAEGEEPLPENVTDIVSDTVRPVLGDGEIPAKPEPGEESAENEENSENTENAAPAEIEEMETDPLVEAGEPAESEGTIEPEDGTEEVQPEGTQPEGTGNELSGKVEEGTKVPSDESTESQESAPAERLQLQVKPVSRSSEEYAAFAAYAANAEAKESAEQLMLQVMNYTLFYDGIELDMTECQMTAEFVPTQALKSYAEGNSPAPSSFEVSEKQEALDEEMGREVTVEILQIASDNQVNQAGYILLGTDDVDLPVEDAPAADVSESEEQSILDEAPVIENDTADKKQEAAVEDTSEEEIQEENIPEEIEIVQTYAAAPKAQSLPVEEKKTVIVNLDTEVRVFAARATGQPNPKFTVQYYANLDILDKTGTNALPVIDTSGKKLPVNGKGTSASPNGNAIKNIYVDDNGNVLKTMTPTEVYKARGFEYHKAPSINYMNALVKNPNYKLKEVWVLKKDKNPVSINRGDWDIYIYGKDLHFTNREVTAAGNDKYIWIKDNTVLRFVYDTTDAKPDFKAAFYDYDISSGRMYTNVTNAISNSSKTGITQTGNQKNRTLYYVYTKQAGINSVDNYSGSGTKLAFGNVNTGTSMGENLWNGNLLNKFNGTQGIHPVVAGSYKGCTFGLVTGLNEGKLQYANGVIAPKLFNEGSTTGKTAYDEDQYSLKFIRKGDTYTLTAVNGTGTTGLESFGHPSPYSGTTHTHIWTNDFWPMDSAGSYGANGHDLKFGSYTYRNNRAYAGSSTTGEPGSTAASKKVFPYSDDGKDHNSYFGMQYAVEFELSKDYVGPLEYYFFGDDDMWVFLDDTLVCDIGGVHSSVGEYVNLWDYLHKHTDACYDAKGNLTCKKGITHEHTDGCYDKDGNLTCKQNTHKLSFFYTERGASGSTCWMQFTLPTVSSLTPETTDDDFGHLKIGKEVMVTANGKDYLASELFKGTEQGELFETKEFKFNLKLVTPNETKDDYAYVKYDKDGKPITGEGGGGVLQWELIADGEDFTLKDGEYILIKYLPQGTTYTITESDTEIQGVVYNDTSIVQDGENVNDPNNKFTVGGTVPKNATSEIDYTNRYTVYALPETGGPGAGMYIIAGAFVMLLGAGFIYRKKARREAA